MKKKITPASLLVTLLLCSNLFIWKRSCEYGNESFKIEDFTGGYDQTWGLEGGAGGAEIHSFMSYDPNKLFI